MVLTVSIHKVYTLNTETITTLKGAFTELCCSPFPPPLFISFSPSILSFPLLHPSLLPSPLSSPLPQVPHVANKFQRLRHFHYFLWILAHGFTSCEEGRGVKEEGEEEGERRQSEPCGSSQLQNVHKIVMIMSWGWLSLVYDNVVIACSYTSQLACRLLLPDNSHPLALPPSSHQPTFHGWKESTNCRYSPAGDRDGSATMTSYTTCPCHSFPCS